MPSGGRNIISSKFLLQLPVVLRSAVLLMALQMTTDGREQRSELPALLPIPRSPKQSGAVGAATPSVRTQERKGIRELIRTGHRNTIHRLRGCCQWMAV